MLMKLLNKINPDVAAIFIMIGFYILAIGISVGVVGLKFWLILKIWQSVMG